MQEFTSLHLSRNNGVAQVSFDNGDINILDIVLVPELMQVVELLKNDPAIKVIVFASALSDYYLSHADFGLLQQLRGQGDSQQVPMYSQLLETIRSMPKVCIAKVAGRARGGGAELALAMDMCFAAEHASFAQMEIIMGIAPGGGGGLYLARKLGRARAMEICLGGGDFSAPLAERYGYINRALPANELDGFVDELAQRIASYSFQAIANNKAVINLLEDRYQDDFISNGQLTGELINSPDFDQRVDKFMQLGGGTAAGELDNWQGWAKKLAEPT